MIYFCMITHSVASKNSLQKAVLAYIKKHDRRVVQAKDLKDYMADVERALNAMHGEYPRCTPLKIYNEKGGRYGSHDDPTVGCSDLFRLTFHKENV